MDRVLLRDRDPRLDEPPRETNLLRDDRTAQKLRPGDGADPERLSRPQPFAELPVPGRSWNQPANQEAGVEVDQRDGSSRRRDELRRSSRDSFAQRAAAELERPSEPCSSSSAASASRPSPPGPPAAERMALRRARLRHAPVPRQVFQEPRRLDVHGVRALDVGGGHIGVVWPYLDRVKRPSRRVSPWTSHEAERERACPDGCSASAR